MDCQPCLLQMLLEFVLGHPWSKNLDLFRVTDVLDDLRIIFAEMVPETPVTWVLGGTVSRDNRGVKCIMLHIRSDDASPLNFVGDADDDSLVAVNPKTNFFIHWVNPSFLK